MICGSQTYRRGLRRGVRPNALVARTTFVVVVTRLVPDDALRLWRRGRRRGRIGAHHHRSAPRCLAAQQGYTLGGAAAWDLLLATGTAEGLRGVCSRKDTSVTCRALHGDGAFHITQLWRAVAPIAAALRRVRFTPRVPIEAASFATCDACDVGGLVLVRVVGLALDMALQHGDSVIVAPQWLTTGCWSTCRASGCAQQQYHDGSCGPRTHRRFCFEL